MISASGPDGLLYISDTNNHRIGAFDRAGDHRFSVKTIDSEVSSEMVWPTRFIFASDGSIFVINKGPMLVGGEIVRLHREDGILDRIELPPGADPMKLLPVDGDLWVTDEARCQGSRYTLEGERLENVESGEFEELLSALHFERTYYRSITSKAQRGLFILLLLLIVIYFFERRQKANEVAVEDPLAGRLDLREIPMIAFPLKKKLKCAALLVGVWFGGSILITLIVMGLSVVGESTADGEVGSLAFRIVTWLLLLTLAVAIFFYICRRRSRRGFSPNESEEGRKSVRQAEGQPRNTLAPDEVIRLRGTPRMLGTGIFINTPGGPFFSDVNLFVVTTRRILLLTTDLFATGLRKIQEISFARIEEMDMSSTLTVQRWLHRWFGSGFLAIKLTGQVRPLRFVFTDAAQAEAAREEILDRAAQIEDGDFPSPGRICLKCFQSAPAHLIAWPSLRPCRATRLDPAPLLALIPGSRATPQSQPNQRCDIVYHSFVCPSQRSFPHIDRRYRYRGNSRRNP